MHKSHFIWLTAIAAFALAIRSDIPIKPFDLLAVILGIAILTDRETRLSAQKLWPEAKPYVKYFFLFFLFTAVAQIVSWVQYDFSPLNAHLLFQYVRLAFNLYTFLLTAFLFYSNKRLIRIASWAIFISPILVLPAHFAEWQASYLEGIRLAGLLDNPIIFGFWMMVAFFIGLGLYLDTNRLGRKFGIALWLVFIANFILWSASRAVWIALPFGIGVLLYLYARERKDATGLVQIIGLIAISFALGQALLITARIPLHARPQGSADEAYAVKSFVFHRAFNLVFDPTRNESRITIWKEAVAKDLRTPWGFGLYGSVSPKQFPGAANSYLEAPEAGGIGALVTFLFILGGVGAAVQQAIRKSGGGLAGLHMAWFTIALAVAVNIFFYNFFFTRVLWFVLGAILGIALGEKHHERSAGVS